MHALNGRLLDLVQKLDLVGPSPSLVDLAQAMEATKLTLADVASYVEANSQNYNRATVVFREHYELLVMTWLPGQASVPHDHAGSICAMQIMQGEALEGSYRVATDGYVDLEYETAVRCGEITAGQDAGVHSVRNPSQSGELLVTVHVYAPPLKDFRRFVPRPELQDGPRIVEESPSTVVIVGGGFSGSMSAAQILRRAGLGGSAVRIVLVERRGAVGEGLAYSTRELSHLLNVPAGRMSAWPDRPDDFVHWASKRHGGVRPEDFLPRQWYGDYIRESLAAAAQEAGKSATLSVVFDEVRRVARCPSGGWMVHLARGTSLRAETVVLAIGHRPPSDPIGQKWRGPRTRFIGDPWRPFAMNVVKPDESVIVLGSGLTAVDAMLSLAQQTRQAPITLVSRRGLLPQAHAATPLKPADMSAFVSEVVATPGGMRALPLSRKLRKMVQELVSTGVDWRSVLDGLRPHTANLWAAMSIPERRRFLKHLRPFWEVHRHRMALAVADRFRAMHDNGEAHIVAGHVVSATAEGDRVRLVVAERGSDRLIELQTSWVINCTGPVPSNNAASNPVIGSLLVDGLLRPDELGLGIETTANGNTLDVDGNEVPDLFIVGTLRKPAYWESTAVPELRNQAALVAERIVDSSRNQRKFC